MNEVFLGKSMIFWVALQAIAVLASNLILAITGWFIYKQLRTAARTFRFDGIRKMQDLVDEFREDRDKIYTTFPIDLVVLSTQFASRPPGRIKKYRVSEGERRRMLLTQEQLQALNSLSEKQISLAKKVIARLNDLGQLAEDRFIDYKVFLGKYHTMIIRLCHFLEAIRREEEEKQGGSYGQRLLRMRRDAVRYNTLTPKHRNVDIKIVTPKGSVIVVAAMDGSIIQRAYWFVERQFFFL